jgi:SAM-dependent methyltransferase
MSFAGSTPHEMIGVYRHLLKVHGPNSPRALGWSSPLMHNAHHHVLTSQVKPGYSVIDFGCGLGDLYQYLQRAKLPVHYEGIDQVPEMVATASQKNPGGHFAVRNSLEGFNARSRDYVVACGVFTFRLVGHEIFLRKTLADFALVARRGFAFDLLALEVQSQLSEDYYAIDRDNLEQILMGLGLKFEITTSSLLKNHFVFVRTGAQ